MKKLKKIIILIMIVIIPVVLTGCDKKEEQTDAYKFAEEYNSINGLENENGKKYRELSIQTENPFVYATAEEIAEKIENKETFIVYFGFSKCPWCRSVLEQLIKVAEEKNVNKIYYVDVLDIRDTKEVNDEGEVVTTKEGTEGYNKLIEQLADVLDDYSLTKDEETISAGEKRIYAPNVVAVSRGKAKQLETGISEELKDPYGKLTDNVKKFAYNKFKCLMDCLEEDSTTCQKTAC